MKTGKGHIVVSLVFFTLMQGCVGSMQGDQSQFLAPPNNNLSPEEFALQIDRIRNRPQQETDRDAHRTHRELTRLLLSPHNPERDPAGAKLEIVRYLKSGISGRNRDEAENLLALLNSIEEQDSQLHALQRKLDEAEKAGKSADKKNNRIEKLKDEIKTLKAEQKKLQTDNKKLESTIEKLKFLDLNLEKKRKSFR